MGGGNTTRPEVPKRLRAVKPPTHARGGGAGSGERDPLELPLCEREQLVAFHGEGEAREGLAVRIALGQPPVLVAAGAIVGEVTDRRKVALVACIEAGYELFGSIVAFDAGNGAGLASVTGVKV